MHIGQVHFQEGYPDRAESVSHRNTGMGERSGIDNDKIHAFIRSLLNPVDEFIFSVTLPTLEFNTIGASQLHQPVIDLSQADQPIMLRLPGPQQIEIWPMQYKNFDHDKPTIDNGFRLSQKSILESSSARLTGFY